LIDFFALTEMPTTKTITLYKFDELSDKAKEKAIERLWDLNVDHEWWDCIYEDAATIGLEITEFDTYRRTIDGKLTEDLPDCCKAIRRNHGKGCETFSTARQYLSEYFAAFKAWLPEQDKEGWEHWKPKDWLWDFDNSEESEEITNDFRKALIEDYLVMLSSEYDYQTSEEQIIESIRANDYDFTEDGRLG
jgi:hypothetical protein